MAMTPKRAKQIVAEFWNEDIPGREEHEIKTVNTALTAIRELELIGKVIAVKRNGQIYLVNKTFLEDGTTATN